MRDRSGAWRHPHGGQEPAKLWPPFLVVAEQSAGVGAPAGGVPYFGIGQLHAEVGALRDPERREVLGRERRRRASEPGRPEQRLRERERRAHLSELREPALHDSRLAARVENVVREENRILRLED